MMRTFFGRSLSLMVAATAALVVLPAPAAHADFVYFSGALTEPNPPLDPADFDATIEYTFAANVLTLTVTNSSNPAFTLSEVLLNVSDDVTGLTLTDDGGFVDAMLMPSSSAGGFGTFDYELDLATGRGVPENTGLASGPAVAVFELTATGTNLDVTDFFTGYTDKYDAVAALKFTQGPGDASTYAAPGAVPGGNVVPEPASFLLLGGGLISLCVGRRFKRP